MIEVETYEPFPRQRAFHASPAKYRLFGGAAGPGKSRALIEEGIAQAMMCANSDNLILRRTFKELEQSIINQFLRDVPWRAMGLKYNASDHVVKFPNGSRIIFGYCASENDVYQYQGGAYLFIGIDEVTFFTLKMWQFLTSRNRSEGRLYTAGPNKGQPAFACMAGASNPGNVGHAWCKALFIDKRAAPGMENPQKYDAADYDFIPALVQDNPIYANDADYLKTLDLLPEMLRRAFLLGDWNIFAGQYFDIFEHGRHTSDPKNLTRKPWNPVWMSIDWGFEHAAACYWHYQDGDRTVTYHELVKNHLTPVALAEKICDEMRDPPTREQIERHEPGSINVKPVEIYLSTEVFRAHSWGEHSIPELMGDVFKDNGLCTCTPADNDRIGGWMLMYQLMQNDLWTISQACPRLIENIPMMTRDPDHLEDCLKVDGDDPADAVRYGLKSKLQPRNKPFEVRVRERVEALHIDNNPTAVMMNMAKIAAEERKRFKPHRFFGPRRGGFRP